MKLFLKADRALSKSNFLLHIKSKTNLVTLIKCDSYLQYFKTEHIFTYEKVLDFLLKIILKFSRLIIRC